MMAVLSTLIPLTAAASIAPLPPTIPSAILLAGSDTSGGTSGSLQ